MRRLLRTSRPYLTTDLVERRLDLISLPSLAMDAALLPAMLAGGAIGVLLIRRIDRVAFEKVALALAGTSAAVLLITA